MGDGDLNGRDAADLNRKPAQMKQQFSRCPIFAVTPTIECAPVKNRT